MCYNIYYITILTSLNYYLGGIIMKIFHEENGRNVVYIQVADILFIAYVIDDMLVPASVFTKVFCNEGAVVTCSNIFRFLRFDLPSEVSFFKSLDFIIDYDNYKSFTDEQFQEQYNKLAGAYNIALKRWKKMSEKEKEDNAELSDFIKKQYHIIEFIEEIWHLKHHPKKWYFPDFVK